MSTLLLSHAAHAEFGTDLEGAAREGGYRIRTAILPPDAAARLADEEAAEVDIAFFSVDVFPAFSRQFFSAVRKAPRLKWLHVFNAGVDHPIYAEMLERGVRLTTSSGTAAKPIAQTAITGLLMLARQVPRWLAAQRERRWDPIPAAEAPLDLKGQTAVILGMGHIGKEIARLARVLGLKVIGVRRSPRQADDPVDELHPPEQLPALAARADWLIIAAPLTPETRGRIDAALLASLPPHARLINIARGEIVDETALIAALGAGRLAGAYLDVFEQEPLPVESPLWDLPNVIVTPHNAGASAGNARRIYALFRENLGRYHRSEPLLNEVTAAGKAAA